MYNDPQGSYPPQQPDPQWRGNGNANNGTQNFYSSQPQNPAPQAGNGTPNFEQGSYPPQNPTPQSQWGNGTPNFQQGSYPPQNPAPVQRPNFVYASPSRRSGLVSSRSIQKNNLSMIMIGGATALALIVGLALFVGLSNQDQRSPAPVIQANAATPTVTPDTTTPTPGATATPMPTPTLVPTSVPTSTTDNTTADTTTPTAYTPPPPAAQQPAPVPTPKPIVPTPTPKLVAMPTVDPESFTYDYNPVNGTLVTNPPADFCTTGHEGPNFGVQCIQPFFPGTGYVVTCGDGKHVSHDGGNGACSQYKGEGKKWYKHPIKK